jgi:hypothetical protein
MTLKLPLTPHLQFSVTDGQTLDITRKDLLAAIAPLPAEGLSSDAIVDAVTKAAKPVDEVAQSNVKPLSYTDLPLIEGFAQYVIDTSRANDGLAPSESIWTQIHRFAVAEQQRWKDLHQKTLDTVRSLGGSTAHHEILRSLNSAKELLRSTSALDAIRDSIGPSSISGIIDSVRDQSFEVPPPVLTLDPDYGARLASMPTLDLPDPGPPIEDVVKEHTDRLAIAIGQVVSAVAELAKIQVESNARQDQLIELGAKTEESIRVTTDRLADTIRTLSETSGTSQKRQFWWMLTLTILGVLFAAVSGWFSYRQLQVAERPSVPAPTQPSTIIVVQGQGDASIVPPWRTGYLPPDSDLPKNQATSQPASSTPSDSASVGVAPTVNESQSLPGTASADKGR